MRQCKPKLAEFVFNILRKVIWKKKENLKLMHDKKKYNNKFTFSKRLRQSWLSSKSTLAHSMPSWMYSWKINIKENIMMNSCEYAFCRICKEFQKLCKCLMLEKIRNHMYKIHRMGVTSCSNLNKWRLKCCCNLSFA